MDKEGNIKLCDFGWAAETNVREPRVSYCGTIDYMAPEMLINEPHDTSLDIWCLGILLFELIHGYAPYQGVNDEVKKRNLIKNNEIKFSSHLSKDVIDLITNIL